MFQALFNSLSGLFSFSRSLNTISNNVSNMNTPGFHGSDVFLANVAGSHGVRVAGEGLRDQTGDLRQTSNDTDVAIKGAGYFILRDPTGNLHYTRAGQFHFDDKGILVDSTTQYQVMAYDNTGALNPINRNSYNTLAAQATTKVRIQGNIVPTASATPPAITNNIVVYDSQGVTHKLAVTFTAVPPVAPATTTTGKYDVKITDEANNDLGHSQIQFDVNLGTMLANGTSTANITITATLPVAGGSQAITFDFGPPGAPNGSVTTFSNIGASLGSHVDDGHGVLSISSMKFDGRGVLQFTYSATETRAGPQLALATFPNEAALHLDGDRMIAGSSVSVRNLGRPGDAGFGEIVGRSLEMSNVDLTQEFADMIIVQRGYQASSRVMTVSNEMIEQLYNSTRGG